MKVVTFSTFPIRKPVHGGQRRGAALTAFYAAHGHQLIWSCVYESPPYGGDLVSPGDMALRPHAPELDGVPAVNDLISGRFAAENPAAYDRFRALVEQERPDALQIDHPFMWPLVRRLRAEGAPGATRFIYSSHNLEAPLKEDILRRLGLGGKRTLEIREQIMRLEEEVVREADLVLSVSPSDAAVYRGWARPDAPVIVAPNGVDRSAAAGDAGCLEQFEGRPFLFFVGSAYLPNSEGFVRLLAEDGFYFLPPKKHVAVCGGVSEAIWQSREYQRYLHANSERVQFFNPVDDATLSALKGGCHAVLLPITLGGGSNLKTAEALAAGKWVVATPTALRGFDAFAEAEGVVVASTVKAYRRAVAEVLHRPPLALSPEARAARDGLYWDRALADSGLAGALGALADARSVRPQPVLATAPR